jgi:steroid delta-isomerase-like uncharacterized protein
MSTEQNLATTRRWIEEGWNRGDFSSVEEMYARDYVSHSFPPQIPGNAEGLKQFISMFRTASPDLHIDVEDLFGADDKVVWRIVARGTQTGPLLGVPATGRPFEVPGMVIFHFNDRGQIREDWANWDQLGMLQQLGVIPQPQTA